MKKLQENKKKDCNFGLRLCPQRVNDIAYLGERVKELKEVQKRYKTHAVSGHGHWQACVYVGGGGGKLTSNGY